MNVLKEISRVFNLEINTLAAVRDSLSQPYAEAVELLYSCLGKVVVTGVGKSGLVAQKIASTMASTGTPATFLHSGDGLHGDVGIIRPEDVVLAISKSGESAEILDLLLFVKNMTIPVVSITASPNSTLGCQSDIVLFTPVAKEACPLVLSQLGFGNCLRKRLRLLPFFRSVDVGGWQPWDENGMWSGWKGKNETSWND